MITFCVAHWYINAEQGCGRSNERPYKHGADYGCTLMVLRLRTLERASLQVGCVVGVEVGARPAQGAATTTDEGLVRTFERASLLVGYITKQSNRTQPVGTYLGASASEGQADGNQNVINVRQRPFTGCLFVVCGRSNERPNG